MSWFFQRQWDLPVASLTKSAQGYLLNDVGVDLRALGRLQEAAQPLSLALEITKEEKTWGHASTVANNLLDLLFIIGDLDEALKVGLEGIELADKDGETPDRITLRAAVGGILQHQGLLEEAAESFRAAERLLVADSFLGGWWGFQYCDLLIDMGEIQQVKERARKALDYAKERNLPTMMGLDFLTLGRAFMVDVTDLTEAAGYIKEAVFFLRQGGQIDRVLFGLLTRAELYRLRNEFENAERDLMEVYRIASRGGMKLHLANYHLEFARFDLAQGNKSKAREHLVTAAEMINRLGYHRRDKEVAELEAQLG